tara:strand:+ start:388 stop:588 length:201 start_codon:yes stop_codon:yes gene_type:complete
MAEHLLFIAGVMMRKKLEILKEIEETDMSIITMKKSNLNELDIEFFNGWIEALKWVLTDTDEEAEA